MLKTIAVAGLLLLGAPVFAQGTREPQPAGTGEEAPPKPKDEGRYLPNDRDGLSGRGGPNAIRPDNSFSATIGSSIFTAIGTPVGSRIGVAR